MALSVLACAISGTSENNRLFANNSDTANPTGKASKPNKEEPVFFIPIL